jgi:group II intron reverse transcriptase/maturase
VATLETPTKLRELRKALYQRAKKEPRFRFYALYDKVYRPDVVAHAYALAKANGGAPGPDGVTFAKIEEDGSAGLLEELQETLKTKQYKPGPVRRVYIPKLNGGERPLGIPNIRDRVVQTAVKLILEPIFEADFDEDSYGFRPKRDAHQALEAIEAALKEGMCWVLDADITAFFDTIPHDRLMKAVAARVVDGAMLALVKMFLEAPIVDDRDGGPPRRNRQGTPQGGVISPLLANIYLDLLDRNFRRHATVGRLQAGKLVRYADDFVLLTRRPPDAERRWVEGLLSKLGLRLNAEKTRAIDARRTTFDFLGHTLRFRFGRVYRDIARKAQARIRDELRRRTRRTDLSLDAIVDRLNPYIRGARNYFRRVLTRRLSYLDSFVRQRVARWWAHKHKRPGPAWSLVQGGKLWRQHGLERWYVPRGSTPAPSRSFR